MLVGAFAEMIGLGSIPIYAAVLTQPEQLFEKYDLNHLTFYFKNLDQKRLLIYSSLILGIIFFLKNILLLIISYFETLILTKLRILNSKKLFSSYLNQPYKFHLNANPSKLVRNIHIELNSACSLIQNLLIIFRESLILLVIFILLLVMDPFLSIAVFLFLGLFSSVFYFIFKNSLKKRGKLSQEHRGKKIQTINQSLEAIKDIKILNREAFMLNEFNRELVGDEKHRLFHDVVKKIPRLYLEVLAILAIIIITMFLIFSGKSISSIIPFLSLLSICIVRMVPSFNAITSALSLIKYGMASFDLVTKELKDEKVKSENVAENDVFIDNKEIKIKNISYIYPDTEKKIIHDLSLEIKIGDSIGIKGKSGIGKSTLINIITGLLEPIEGDIIWNKESIKKNIYSWRKNIGYIPQDIYLLDNNIKRNIAFGIPEEKINTEILNKVVRLSYLENFISNLDLGLETPVGNRGIKLSGGQRQRIGIARALYNDPGILIFDEATSSLDKYSEKEVLETIKSFKSLKTMIIVSHRDTTLENCNKIFELKNGKLFNINQ